MTRVLVCGSRTWRDQTVVEAVLNGLLWQAASDDDELTVIEGGAEGADRIAASWAFGEDEPPHLLHHEQYTADWANQGRGAGPRRNQRMLDEGKPEVVYAFTEQPPTTGTADMLARAAKAGVPAYVISHYHPAVGTP